MTEAEGRYRAMIESAVDFAILAADPDGRVTTWSRGAERLLGWPAAEMVGEPVDRFFTPEDRAIDRPRTEMRLALETGRATDERWHLRRDGSRFWASGELMPLRGEAGEHLGFVKILRDRTAEHEARERERIVNQEISHRLKNTMAMVQAIVTQTLREVSGEVPLDELMSRLQALATAHDVLLQRTWDGASLRTLVEGVLAPFGDGRISIAGPAVDLSSRATLSASLVFHELGTNALKYGALSVPGGRVELTWGLREAEGGTAFALSWRERGGPPPAPAPTRRGFGSRLLRMGLIGTGGAELRYLPTGLEVDMTALVVELQQS